MLSLTVKVMLSEPDKINQIIGTILIHFSSHTRHFKFEEGWGKWKLWIKNILFWKSRIPVFQILCEWHNNFCIYVTPLWETRAWTCMNVLKESIHRRSSTHQFQPPFQHKTGNIRMKMQSLKRLCTGCWWCSLKRLRRGCWWCVSRRQCIHANLQFTLGGSGTGEGFWESRHGW